MELSKRSNLTEWANLYTGDLLKYSIYKVSNYESAEDLVQDTFEAANKSYDNFDKKSSPKTWLFGILKNKIKDYYRQKNNSISADSMQMEEDKFNLSDFFDEDGNWLENKSPKDWGAYENDNLFDNEEFIKIFELCLKQLPEKWNSCICMKYIENMKGSDICSILNISQTNFWQILHRAKLQLRNCLELKWFN